MEKMTIERMFGIEPDEVYFARTTEEERIEEAKECIIGMLVNDSYKEGWNIERHIDMLLEEGLFSAEGAERLKRYMEGFAAGYQRANADRDKVERQRLWTKEAQEFAP